MGVTDAWGKVTETAGSLKVIFGTLNPMRYRGYYQDVETELYVTATHYYDAGTGRFINADTPEVLELTQRQLLVTNLFAYCFNNPVNYSDHSGMIVTPANVIGAVIGEIIGAVGGYFLTNWFAEMLGLRGLGKTLFV